MILLVISALFAGMVALFRSRTSLHLEHLALSPRIMGGRY
jgi:hypothetical protein